MDLNQVSSLTLSIMDSGDSQSESRRGSTVAYNRRRGYGFIRPSASISQSEDVFFHVKEIAGKEVVTGNRITFPPKAEADGCQRRRMEAAQIRGGTRPEPGEPRTEGKVEFVQRSKNYALVRSGEEVFFLHSSEMTGLLLNDWNQIPESMVGRTVRFSGHRRATGARAP